MLTLKCKTQPMLATALTAVSCLVSLGNKQINVMDWKVHIHKLQLVASDNYLPAVVVMMIFKSKGTIISWVLKFRVGMLWKGTSRIRCVRVTYWNLWQLQAQLILRERILIIMVHLLSCLLQSCCVNYTVDVSCVPHCLLRDEGKKVGFIRRSSQVTTNKILLTSLWVFSRHPFVVLLSL